MTSSNDLKPASRELAGRICMVTGASSGIGKETALQLANMGADLVIVCRSKEKGRRTTKEIKSRSGSKSVELLTSDFASLDSVRGLTKEFAKGHNSLNVLVNNVGLVKLRRTITTDGFETTFQVNYLSHFLLTNLLLDSLRKGAPSRIVNVSSVAYLGGHIDFDDLQLERGYGVMKAYSESKLALVLFTQELARRLEGTGVTANCLHPGAVATNIWGGGLGPIRHLAKIGRLFMLSPEEGAETPVYLASSPEVEGVSGKYFERKREKEASTESNDETIAKRLWEVSETMVELRS